MARLSIGKLSETRSTAKDDGSGIFVNIGMYAGKNIVATDINR